MRRSLEENCLICHTEDMIAGQRLTPAQWKAEVDKMVNWGAPLPKEEAAPLVEYLAQRSPTGSAARPVPVDAEGCGLPRGPGRPRQGGSGGRRPGPGRAAVCRQLRTCHGPTALGGDLGPSLAAKAILDHPREYDQIVNQGLRRMPGFRLTMTARDQADVLAWLRRRAYP